MKITIVLCLSLVISSHCQAQVYPGTVIQNDGTAREGSIYVFSTRDYHEKVSFKDNKDGKDYTYLPGDIKAFVVQGPKMRAYESLAVDSTATHFFLREFSDDRIKYYYYVYKKKGKKDERGEYLTEVYMVDNKVANIDYNRQDEALRDMDDESWVDGGIIQSNGDTLTGMIYTKFAHDDKKVTFQDTKSKTEQKFEIGALNGYFVKDLTFQKVYFNKEKEKDAMVRLVTGADEPVQLFADYKEKRKGPAMPIGPSFGAFSFGYTPTYLDVDFFVKKEGTEDVLKLNGGWTTTGKDKIQALRTFFGDYPRLATAAIQGSITREKAIVNLYNLYKSL